jgi:hypothetical protein
LSIQYSQQRPQPARQIVSALIEDGLLQSQSHRAPLTIGLPIGVLPYYFPDLYDPLSNW